jgi:hypothetical protein
MARTISAMGKAFKHHNPYFAATAEALMAGMDENARQNPQKRINQCEWNVSRVRFAAQPVILASASLKMSKKVV